MRCTGDVLICIYIIFCLSYCTTIVTLLRHVSIELKELLTYLLAMLSVAGVIIMNTLQRAP